MLTKLFWVLLVSSLIISFIFRDYIQDLYINKFVNQGKKGIFTKTSIESDKENITNIKDYVIDNLTLATNTNITLKDKEYIYTFIKRLESNSIKDLSIEKNKEKSRVKVLSVYYDNYGDAYLHLDKGEIRLNIFNDLDTVWNDYLSAIGDSKLSYKLKNERDNLDYLDLRFPNKLFYKFKTTSSSTNININKYDQRILGTSTISSSTGQ